MIEHVHKLFRIVSGPALGALLQALTNETQISFVVESKTEEKGNKKRVIVVLIDGFSFLSKRVKKGGRILRQFGGSCVIYGIALVGDKWRSFDCSYNTDGNEGSGNGEIQVGSAVKIVEMEADLASSKTN